MYTNKHPITVNEQTGNHSIQRESVWHGMAHLAHELTGRTSQELFVLMKEQPLELTLHTTHLRELSKGIHNILLSGCLPISSSIPNMEIHVGTVKDSR